MLLLILSGPFGYFVFDILRVNAIRTAEKRLEITIGDLLGVSIHLALYVCASIVGFMSNIDVVGTCSSKGFTFYDVALDAAYLRAFALGLGGPSALSKWHTHGGRTAPAGRSTLDDFSGSGSHVGAIVRRLLLR